MERESTLSDYLSTLRRRWWLIALPVVLFLVAGGVYATRQTKLFRATAQVLVSPSPLSSAGAGRTPADAQAVYDSTQAELAHTLKVADAAAGAARVPGVTGNVLLQNSSVTSSASSNILTFAVVSSQRSAAISLVNAFAGKYGVYKRQLDTAAIDGQLRGVDGQVADTRRQIDAAKTAGVSTAQLHVKLNQLLRTQSSLQNLKALQTGGAVVASSATGAVQTQPDLRRTLLIASALGLVLGIGLTFLIDALDTRVRSSDDVAAALGLQLLAGLPTPPKQLRAADRLAMLSDSAGTDGEPYRQLQVAIDYANLGVGARMIMLTSGLEKEGKSTTAANLAVAFARTGRRVGLLDLDLRRPVLAGFFGLPQSDGFTDVVSGGTALDEAMIELNVSGGGLALVGENGADAASHGGRLLFLPPGHTPSAPSEFLQDQEVGRVLAEVKSRCDIVIIDSAPLLPVTDSVALGSVVDAILFVVRGGEVNHRALADSKRLLSVSRATVLGFVLTASESEAGYQNYGGGYYAYRATDERDAQKPEPGLGGRRPV